MTPDFYATASGYTVPGELLAARAHDLMQMRSGSIPHVSLAGGGDGDDDDDKPKLRLGWLQ